MATTIKIDRLNSDNYDTWKIYMRAILVKNDRQKYVSGSLPKPQLSDSKKWTEKPSRRKSLYVNQDGSSIKGQ